MICGVIGVALLVVLAFVHLGFYCKYIKGDQEFVRWVKKNSCANGSMLTVATAINFKFFSLYTASSLAGKRPLWSIQSQQTHSFHFNQLTLRLDLLSARLCWLRSQPLQLHFTGPRVLHCSGHLHRDWHHDS
jgi:hypothetical protein